MHAQDQHADRGIAPADLSRGLDPVQQRHADIEHGNVWTQLERRAHGRAAIGDLAYDFKSVLVLENSPQALPNDRVIVAEQYREVCHAILPYRMLPVFAWQEHVDTLKLNSFAVEITVKTG
jgi:hypothetical protein